MSRIGKGDEVALAELYDLHGGMVYGLALQILGTPQDAEEVTYDIFMQVWESADSYDCGRGSVRAWLATMTRSRAADRRRSITRRRKRLERAASREGGSFCVAPGSPPDTPGRAYCRAKLAPLLAAIPDSERAVILLAFFRGMSQREIATELDMPLGTVKSRIRSGMARLIRLCGHERSRNGTSKESCT